MSFKTKSQLADEFGMSLSTFQRRLKAVNLNVPRGLISPDAQKEIFKRLNVVSLQN